MIFQKGDQIDQGKYLIKSLLGSGGMGEVYLAYQTSIEREVAIKALYPRLTHERITKLRFHREAKLMAKLNHPHCVTVYDFGETEDGTLYIVMERLKGHTLAEELILKGTIPLNQTLSIIRQACLALNRAHALSLVHRDLKPENIFLTPREASDQETYSEALHVTILDFGIAKVLDSSDERSDEHAEASDEELDETLDETLDGSLEGGLDVTLDPSTASPQSQPHVSPAQARRREQRSIYTQEHVLIGTPLYMSPEHSRNAEIDHRSDIYALGLILYECLSGQPAFKGTSVAELLIAHARQRPPRLSDVRPDLPQKISELIECCLAKRKEERLREVSLIINCIQRFQAGEQIDEALEETLSATLAGVRLSQERLDRDGVGAHADLHNINQSSTSSSQVSWRSRVTLLGTLLGVLLGALLGALALSGELPMRLNTPSDSGVEAPHPQVNTQITSPQARWLRDTKWSDLYTSGGFARPHSTTRFFWAFERDLFGRTAKPDERIPLITEKSSALIWRDRELWREYLSVRRAQREHQREHQGGLQELQELRELRELRGVRFNDDLRRRLSFDSLVRLPAEFTLELWVYLDQIQSYGDCDHPIISTLRKQARRSAICNYDSTYWVGGWSLNGKSSASRLQLEWLRVMRAPKTQEASTYRVSAPTPLYYQRWSHVALIRDADTLTWVINGVVSVTPDPLHSIIEDDRRISLGDYFDDPRSASLNMRIDDLRVSSVAIPAEWVQRAYRAISERVKLNSTEASPPFMIEY